MSQSLATHSLIIPRLFLPSFSPCIADLVLVTFSCLDLRCAYGVHTYKRNTRKLELVSSP